MTVASSPGVLVQDLARLAEAGPQSARTRVWGPGDDWTISDGTAGLATIEDRYSLAPLTTRDASVNSLAPLFRRH